MKVYKEIWINFFGIREEITSSEPTYFHLHLS